MNTQISGNNHHKFDSLVAKERKRKFEEEGEELTRKGSNGKKIN